MSKLLSLLIAFLMFACLGASAQSGTPVDSTTVANTMKVVATKYPKFYRELTNAKAQDKLIKDIIFVRYERDNGPAKAGPRGNIFIDIKYLETEQPGFDDSRLIVVLYHEIGHLHYFLNTPVEKRNPQDSEQAAFEYSLLITKQMAEKGDCLPLKTGVKFMKMRSESNNLADPHVVALKRMVNQPLYAEYVLYVKEHCS